MTIRTGCSSSLVALHEACQALQSGDCKSAVVAGCNLILTPTMTMAMAEQGVLSPEGISKSFDASADGYGRGEGINAVLVKKLDDAIRDGDPVRAIIRSTATNCDGKTTGISMPSPEAHEAMIRHAYHVAGIKDFSQTAFVECHATGTPIGDPLELRAIARVFGSQLGTYIGSIKPNVGHGEGASGLSSLIKAVLALEHRIIPPNIFFNNPNPKIPFQEANLRVPVEAIPWPMNQLERASINSFGIGGANAHVVLESAASFGVLPISQRDQASRPQLLLFSANNVQSLQDSLRAHEKYLESNACSLEPMASTLSLRRDHHPHRAFGIKSEGAPLHLSSLSKSKSMPELVFIFTGQGAQWATMGKELLRDFPSFYSDFQDMQESLAKVPHPPRWQLLGISIRFQSVLHIN
jgi:acyl transferase domain-containing protein